MIALGAPVNLPDSAAVVTCVVTELSIPATSSKRAKPAVLASEDMFFRGDLILKRPSSYACDGSR